MANSPKQLNFLNPSSSQTGASDEAACCKKPLEPDRYELFTDGACKGNPGPASIGILCKKNREMLWEKGFYIGNATNNIAEYCALVVGLKLLWQETSPTTALLNIFSDSQLLVFQLNGMYKSKSAHLKHLLDEAHRLLKNFSWNATYIPREQNSIADKLANQGLSKKNLLPPELQLNLLPFNE